MSTSRISWPINASREEVYRALIDPELVKRWKVPSDMTCVIHEWNAAVGGSFRVSLTYRDESAVGKSSEHSDTYHGRFTSLIENVEVCDEIEFETDEPSMHGVMTTQIVLTDDNGRTRLEATHRNLPPGLSVELNTIGWRESLDRLKLIVEGWENRG